MATEMSINMRQLEELVHEVQKTKRPQKLRVADGVVAVFMAERQPAARKTKPRRADHPELPKTMTLEQAFGSVPTPAHLKGKDIEEIIQMGVFHLS